MKDARRSQWDIIIFLSGVCAVVLFDRLTKNFFSGFLDLNESIAVIPHVLYFTLVHNTGIAFGFFKDCGMVFIIIPVILTGLLIYNAYYYRHSPRLSRTYIVAFSLILGGAIGNLIDRIFFGYVIDFIDFRVWPVFNLADSAITIGAAIILLKMHPGGTMKQTYIVQQEYKDLRLDVYLANAMPEAPSRMFIKKMIEAGGVKVNGRRQKVKYKVAATDCIEADINEEAFAPKDLPAEKMDLDVFYEDEDLAVINKPEGLTVHPASGSQSGTLVNGLMYRYQELSDVNGAARPGIVHRLDRDTSGLILIAKTNVAHARLGRQFEKHTVVKRYVARVQGRVQFDQGIIDVPLEKHKKYHDHRQVAKEGAGKQAVTMYQVLKRYSHSTLVALYPQTGRTHQLRVHMKHLGHPILGDEKYGRRESFPRLGLHAQSIAFTHPQTRARIEFSCPTPQEFLKDDL